MPVPKNSIDPGQLATFKAHINSFVQIDDDDLSDILKYFGFKKLSRGEPLIQVGNPVKETFWVLKGLLTSNYVDPAGKEYIIQFALENCWITDQQAFYTQTNAIFQIVAIENSELLSLSFKNREKLCSSIHKMETFFRKKANDSFVKQQKRLLTYLTSDAEGRYELLAAEYPQLIQRLSKKTLAAYLGVSRETLSRFHRR